MNRNRRNPHPADPPLRARIVRGTLLRSACARELAARSTLWVLGPSAMALLVTPILAFAGAGSDWVAFTWLMAVLWAIAASFVQALWQGLRHGDRSAFSYCELPRNDDNFDFCTKTGRYAYLRIQADHETLMRESDRLIENHDHGHGFVP